MKIGNKIKISFAFFVLSVFLIFVFLLRPILDGIGSDSKELGLQKEEFAGLEARISSLEDFKTVRKGLEEFVEETNSLFVSSSVPIDFINFLEDEAQKSGLEIKISSNVIKTEKKDAWSFLVFQVTTKGQFTDQLGFLKKIEKGDYLAEISSLNVSRMENSGVSVNFSVKVFSK